MRLLLLDGRDVQRLADTQLADAAVRVAFGAMQDGEFTLPQVLELDLTDRRAEIHAKGAFLHAAEDWALKVSSAFSLNPQRGIPAHSGLTIVFDANDGRPQALIVDGGFLTELRTGAAGALSSDLLARRDATVAAVIGAGSQARFQLAALARVRAIDEVRITARSHESATALAAEVAEVAEHHPFAVSALADPEEAVAGADVVITTTPAREPILRGEWLSEGAHVVAVGADSPAKRELDRDVMRRATVIAVDDVGQATTRGELRHALNEGSVDARDVVTLAALLAGEAPGRAAPADITVADLTGVGTQDAAIASLVVTAARRRGVGRRLELRDAPAPPVGASRQGRDA